MPELKIYKSSAGSGKTFTLVKEYLKLVLQKPRKYKHILAVTFTNKATAEMKGRIIEALENLTFQNDEILANQILEELQPYSRNFQLSYQAQKVLDNILHDYSHFAVSTIDSFFYRIIQAFARELGLPVNFEVELDTDSVLDEAIDHVMAEIGKDQDLTRWLREFAFTKMEDNRSWDFRKEIRNLGRELFREQFYQRENLFGNEKIREKLGPFAGRLRTLQEAFKDEVLSRANRIIRIIKETGLDPVDFRMKAKSIPSSIQKFTGEFDYEKLERIIARIKKLDSAEDLTTKNNPENDRILECWENGLREAFEEFAGYYHKYYPQYISAREVNRMIYAFGILADLHEKVKEYRAGKEVLLISDLNYILNRVTRESPAPFIFEKAGNTYHHFLLDEFQDTSGFQWQNLKPLVENSLSNRQFSMVVGDAKQSIYRWRGGDLSLLLVKLQQDFSHFRDLVNEESLSVNHRSLRTIVEFNNRFFSIAPRVIISQKQWANGEILEGAFHEVEQQVKQDNDREGYVNIRFLKNDRDNNWQEEAREAIPDTVKKLLDQGFQWKDIAILVRTNKEAQETAKFLSADPYYYPVISADSLVLFNSTKVKLLVNLLRYLNDPGDEPVKYRLVYDYCRYIRKNDGFELNDLFLRMEPGFQAEDFLPPAFREKKPYLLSLPLYELIEHLVGIFEFHRSPDAYLQKFMDLVLEFSVREGQDTGSFLDWWEETGYREAIELPEQANALRIDTIHKAKGLQFPVVLIPFAQWKFQNTGEGELIWASSGEAPFDRFPVYPLQKTGKLEKSHFAGEYKREELLTYIDNLNLFYVAFTRPQKRLYVTAPFPSVDRAGEVKRFSGIAELLFETMKETEFPPVDAADLADAEHPPVWEFGEETVTKEREKKRDMPVVNNFNFSPWQERLTIRPRGKQLLKEFEENYEEKVGHGILVHGILEKIAVKSDLDRALNEVYLEGLIRETDKETLKSELLEILSIPEVESWFSGEWEVKNEPEILFPGGKISRPDRVMIQGANAILVDYKSGAPHRSHENQVREYGRALKEMGYSRVEKFLLYLEEKRVQKVKED